MGLQGAVAAVVGGNLRAAQLLQHMQLPQPLPDTNSTGTENGSSSNNNLSNLLSTTLPVSALMTPLPTSSPILNQPHHNSILEALFNPFNIWSPFQSSPNLPSSPSNLNDRSPNF